MKKRIFGFALVLCLLLCSFSMTAMAADSTELNVYFNEVPIGQDLVNWARVTDAFVVGAERLDAAPQDDEKNRIHIQVELSNATQDGDVVHVEMSVSEQTAAGLSSALKANKGSIGIGGGDDLYYNVTIENGKGRMTCYSYYNYTEYTTVIIDFVVGDQSGEWVAPHHGVAGDAVLQQIRVWDEPVLKTMFKNTGKVPPISSTANGDHQGVSAYIWLEESVADDAVIGLEVIRSNSNFFGYPESWTSKGGYVQLKNGEAVVQFKLQGLSPGPVGQNRLVTVYIKNHLDHNPIWIGNGDTIEVQTEVDVPYIVDLRDYFVDADGNDLVFDVSVDGGEAVRQSSYKYRYIPGEAGTRTLKVTAFDGKYYSEQGTIVLNATTDHVWGEWSVVTPATCTKDGERTHTCTCCNAKETETIKASGEHDWDEWVTKKNANCVDDGSKLRTCVDCGAMEKGVIPAGECDWVVVSSTATCGEAGKETAVCPGCNEEKVIDAPATGKHVWGKWTEDNAPTCSEAGAEIRTCSGCDQVETREISATGVHGWDSWEVTKAPSCVDGERERICTDCELTETAPIAANGQHAWNDWEVVTEATPDEEGLEIRICAHCDAFEEKVIYYKEPFAYVNLSIRGKIELSMVEIPLIDNDGVEGITMNDVMYTTHELYAPGGRNSYASSNGYVNRLWGESGVAIGYLRNHVFTWDINEPVENGDVIDAYIYQDEVNFGDFAAYFNKDRLSVDMGQSFELTLYRIIPGNTLANNRSEPVKNADILIDGETTAYRTDAQGKVTLSFEKGGSYVVSAVSDKYILVPPICVVDVDSRQTKLTAPVLTDASVTTTSILVTPPAPSVQDPEAKVEYAISSDGKIWSLWQKDNLFTKLTLGTEYQIRARYVTANTNRYLHSDPSETFFVSTSDGASAVYDFADVSGKAGDVVEIPVRLMVDAEDICRWNAELDYDSEVFTLIGMEKGSNAADWEVKLNRVTRSVNGKLLNGKGVDGFNGELFVLKLKVKETATPGSYIVGLGDVWNTASQNAFWNSKQAYAYVKGQTVASTVTVEEQIIVDDNVSENPIVKEEVVFQDVAKDTWYSEPVQYMAETELMKGTAEDTFAPEMTTSRAMLVTLLYRMEGEPETSAKAPFEDVAKGSYYADAVAWAAENDIVFGVSETMFAPDEDVTREQVAAILYRYQNYLGLDTASAGDLDVFADAATVSAYAETAMEWAVGNGLILGIDGNLVPHGNATRAQSATILARFLGE